MFRYLATGTGCMEHGEPKRTVKADPFVWNEQKGFSFTNIEGRGALNVEKLRGYYDEARNRLRTYLGREEAMGSGSSSPRKQDDGGGGGGGGGEGGVMFQHRPAHVRLEGKQVVAEEEFTDISYSDLGFIITPQSKKLTVNNNYPTENSDTCRECSPTLSNHFTMGVDLEGECDFVSTEVVENGNSNFPSNINLTSSNPIMRSNSLNSNSSNIVRSTFSSLQHRGSDGSFTMSHVRASDKGRGSPMSDNNLDDLRLEEITT